MSSCYYCKRIAHHHCSICPKKFDHGQLFNGISGQSCNGTGDQSSSGTGDQTLVTLGSESAQSQPSMATSEADVVIASVANNVNLSHSLLACGERVLLQTAKVSGLVRDGS